jgi:hypothetical protein
MPLAVDIGTLFIQAARFVDQQVHAIDGLDEARNRSRVAAVRQAHPVQLDHTSHGAPIDWLMIDQETSQACASLQRSDGTVGHRDELQAVS